jgi:demethylmenaquinone methyltransferase/2-methoxy-6-polyprenyl-1,4-benzoquinol methylase
MSLSTAERRTELSALDGPVSAEEKARFVRKMFDGIAPRYDLLNSLLSAGVHHGWRRFAVRCAALAPGDCALDICCGTGDFARELRQSVGKPGRIVGIDFSRAMLDNGRPKMERAAILRAQADAIRLPFSGDAFDAVTVAFGIRNVARIDQALREIARVLRPGGRFVCLEFANPEPSLFKTVYDAYSKSVLPRVGGLLSGNPHAYAYLPESVSRFHSRADLAAAIAAAGFDPVRYVDLTFGIVCVHVGIKGASAPAGAGERL